MIKEIEFDKPYIDTRCIGFDEAIAYIENEEPREYKCQRCSKIKPCFKISHYNTWTEWRNRLPRIEHDEYTSWFCEDCIKKSFEEE